MKHIIPAIMLISACQGPLISPSNHCGCVVVEKRVLDMPYNGEIRYGCDNWYTGLEPVIQYDFDRLEVGDTIKCAE